MIFKKLTIGYWGSSQAGLLLHGRCKEGLCFKRDADRYCQSSWGPGLTWFCLFRFREGSGGSISQRGQTTSPGAFSIWKLWSKLLPSCCGCLVAWTCLTLWDPMDCSPSGSSLSMGFPKQEYWSGLPFPFPGDLPDPGIKPGSLALAGRFFTTEPPGKSLFPLLELKLAISRHRTCCSHQLWEISQQAIPQSYWIKRKHPGKSGLCLQRCLPLPLAFYLGFHSISLLKQKSILKARKPHVGWEGFRLEYISNFSENSQKWKEN